MQSALRGSFTREFAPREFNNDGLSIAKVLLSYTSPHASTNRVIYHSQHRVVISSFTRRHWGLTASSLVILWSALFPALAGSLFIVQLAEVMSTNNVTLVGALGINYDFLSSAATWIVAAGVRYVHRNSFNREPNTDSTILSSMLIHNVSLQVYLLSVSHHPLTYVRPVSSNPNLPPFVVIDVNDTTQGWMIPAFTVRVFSEEKWHPMTRLHLYFQVPQVPGNVSLISDGAAYINVETQVLNVQAECHPAKISNVSLEPTGNLSFYASLSSTCSQRYTAIIFTNFTAWRGAFDFASFSCVHDISSTAPSTDNYTLSSFEPVAPVVFGFVANETAVSAAFCYGYQRAYNATVKFDLRLGTAVWPLVNLTYIPGHDLEQFTLNGYVPIDFPYNYKQHAS